MRSYEKTKYALKAYRPVHPGEYVYIHRLKRDSDAIRELLTKLDIKNSDLSTFLMSKAKMSPELAKKLSVALGHTPQFWIAMQFAHEVWECMQPPTKDGLPNLNDVKTLH